MRRSLSCLFLICGSRSHINPKSIFEICKRREIIPASNPKLILRGEKHGLVFLWWSMLPKAFYIHEHLRTVRTEHRTQGHRRQNQQSPDRANHRVPSTKHSAHQAPTTTLRSPKPTVTPPHQAQDPTAPSTGQRAPKRRAHRAPNTTLRAPKPQSPDRTKLQAPSTRVPCALSIEHWATAAKTNSHPTTPSTWHRTH